jgi:hypothetical protein
MGRCVRAVWLMGALTAVVMSQTRGETPPALVWEKLKGSCPASLEWASLDGKVVLVSFRADDVFPEDVADWAEVPQKLRGKPVVFVQIVGGSEFLLDQALKGTESPGCILFDRAHSNAQNFKLPSFLGTVTVDKRGVIADYSRGDPDEGRILAVLGDEHLRVFPKRHRSRSEMPPQQEKILRSFLKSKFYSRQETNFERLARVDRILTSQRTSRSRS